MSDHIVKAYTDELQDLTDAILLMGGRAEAMIADVCEAMIKGDLEAAKEIVARDAELDNMEAAIERDIVSLLARRQPMAHDLRRVMAALKISGELERIGDLSKNVAKRMPKLGEFDNEASRKGVKRMGKSVSLQLQAVLNAYASDSTEGAVAVWKGDEDIDQHYNSLFREMLTYMIEDPRTIGGGAHMLFIAKNLERIGDHCTNIAEFVYFQTTGEYLTLEERPKVNQFAEPSADS